LPDPDALPDPGEITILLEAGKKGHADAQSRLVALMYKELQVRARAHMLRERREHTLRPTALVHETFLRLMHDTELDLKSRSHFMAIASIVMRRVLVDHARQRAADKRPDAKPKVELKEAMGAEVRLDHMLVLDEALNRLAALDGWQAQVVELLFFGGMTEEEAAETLDVSVRSIKRDSRSARAWLQVQLGDAVS
jgi:RNA polymerase sigma factor (TIGR02999 family)